MGVDCGMRIPKQKRHHSLVVAGNWIDLYYRYFYVIPYLLVNFFVLGPPTTILYVNGLTEEMDESSLLGCFEKAVGAKIPMDFDTGKSKR